jgi:hypothetical protein
VSQWQDIHIADNDVEPEGSIVCGHEFESGDAGCTRTPSISWSFVFEATRKLPEYVQGPPLRGLACVAPYACGLLQLAAFLQWVDAKPARVCA